MARGWIHRQRRLRSLRTRNQRNGRRRWLTVGLIALGLIFVLTVLGAGIGWGVYSIYARDLVDPVEKINSLPSSGAKIYDRNGNLLYQYIDDTSGLRQPVHLDQISPYLIAATVSTEDASFWENPGVNVKGLARAAGENLMPGTGFFEGSGGSSITQQLVKNVYIPPEDWRKGGWARWKRKLRETIYALELTRKYSKSQILEWYLNQISYGGIYYGVEAAAQGYFGKSAKDLTLAEAALLAGIPASPKAYNPLDNPQAAVERRNQVLTLMYRRGRIQVGEDQWLDISAQDTWYAATTPLTLVPQRFPIQAPHWVFDYIEPQLKGLFGEQALLRGGLKVYTTLDLDLQAKAQAALENWISQFEDSSGGHNGAFVAIDPNTGEILVFIGSRDYFRDDIQGRNDMAMAPNSPGSSLKPFVYLGAFHDLGWGPGTMILDSSICYEDTNGNFCPRNPKGDFQGPITVRNALGASLNVPAFKTALYEGVSNVQSWFRKMGLTDIDRGYGPSIAIGGVDVKLVDEVYAYSVLAANGTMRGVPTYFADPSKGERELDPVSILRVEDRDGRVIYPREGDQVVAQERQVVAPEYAYMVTDILSDPQAQCITFGCGGLNIGRKFAVKTGTSEPYENSRAIGDTWAVGYTPQLVAGVWAGNADNSPMVNITSTSISWRALRDFMLAALEDKPEENFTRPSGLETGSFCIPSGLLPSPRCPRTTPPDLIATESKPTKQDDWWRSVAIDMRTGLLATAATPKQFIIERFSLVVPDDQPAFVKSQAAEWAKVIGGGTAPGEASSNDIPVAITSPASGAVVSGTVTITGKADSKGFIAYRLEFGAGNPPWAWTGITRDTRRVAGGTLGTWNVSGLPPGEYTLRLVLEDAERGELSTFVVVRVGAAAPGRPTPRPTPAPKGTPVPPTPTPRGPSPTPDFSGWGN